MPAAVSSLTARDRVIGGVAQLADHLGGLPLGAPRPSQQDGDQHRLRRRAERGVRSGGRLAKVLAQVDPEIRQIELVARHQERYLLLDEALALVGCEGAGHVDHGHPGQLAQLVHLASNVGQSRPVGPLVDRQENLPIQELQFPDLEGVLQEIRQLAGTRPRPNLWGDSQGLMQIRVDGGVHGTFWGGFV